MRRRRYHIKVKSVLSSRGFRLAAPIVVVGGGSALFLALLLRRFPFSGLYGIDAYAYYYQAQALLRELLGQPPDPGALFDTGGLGHWPIGYHLLIGVGLLLGGPGTGGPHLLTLAAAAL